MSVLLGKVVRDVCIGDESWEKGFRRILWRMGLLIIYILGSQPILGNYP
jgi:hypothetical protein